MVVLYCSITVAVGCIVAVNKFGVPKADGVTSSPTLSRSLQENNAHSQTHEDGVVSVLAAGKV
jgi:hypothetical protein